MSRKDLVVLAADKHMQFALARLLRSRTATLGIREVAWDVFVHPQHDPACARDGVPFLARFASTYEHGLLVFDHEGSGEEQIPPATLQRQLDESFAQSAWDDRAKAIVVDPELEAWVWSRSPHVAAVVGWANQTPSLRSWLVAEGWIEAGETKPHRPKEALDAALHRARVPHSASLFDQLAARVSVENCQDRSFGDLREVLRTWFPRSDSGTNESPRP